MEKLHNLNHHIRPVTSQKGRPSVKKENGDSQRIASRWEEVSDKKKIGKIKEKSEEDSASKQKKKAAHPAMSLDRKQNLKEDSGRQSPFEMFSRQQKQAKFEIKETADKKEDDRRSSNISHVMTADKEDHFENDEVREETEISQIPSQTISFDQAVNDPSFKVDAPIFGEKTTHLSKASPNELMTKLAAELVQKIVTQKSADRSEVIITLKNTPNFEGAKLKITEFKTAKGQYNIELTNLPTAKAHSLVTDQSNINILRQAMSERGYTVHIVTATTEEKVLQVENASTYAREERGSREGRQERDDQQQEEEKNS